MLTRFQAATFHVADFSDDELGAIGRGLILSDAAGVDDSLIFQVFRCYRY